MCLTLKIRVLLACIIALVLTIIPVPSYFASLRPSWILLLVLYCQFFLPNLFYLTVIIFLGLFLDILLSTTLGEHSLALVITTWLASSKVQRFHMFPMLQQMLLIALFCFIYQLTLYYIDARQGFNSTLFNVIGTTLMSFLIWPWIQLILSNYFNTGIQKRDKFIKQVLF